MKNENEKENELKKFNIAQHIVPLPDIVFLIFHLPFCCFHKIKFYTFFSGLFNVPALL